MRIYLRKNWSKKMLMTVLMKGISLSFLGKLGIFGIIAVVGIILIILIIAAIIFFKFIYKPKK
jgi:hypothetical protein